MPVLIWRRMPRKKATRRTALDVERERLRELLDAKLGPRESSIKIYRLDSDGRQELMGADTLDLLEGNREIEETIRGRFGPGEVPGPNGPTKRYVRAE